VEELQGASHAAAGHSDGGRGGELVRVRAGRGRVPQPPPDPPELLRPHLGGARLGPHPSGQLEILKWVFFVIYRLHFILHVPKFALERI